MCGNAVGTTQAALTVNTVDDPDHEVDGTVAVEVLPATGYDVGSPSTATVAVEDDDPSDESLPRVSVSVGTATVGEGSTVTFGLIADSALTTALSINVRVTEESGDVLASGQSGTRSVTMNVGATRATMTVNTVDDSTHEVAGSVRVEILPGGGYEIGSSRTATVTVEDNDLAQVSVAADLATVDEGTGAAFTLTANSTLVTAISVMVSVTEEAGATLASGQTGTRMVTMNAGTTRGALTVDTVDDSDPEVHGSVKVEVQTGTGYQVGSPPAATVTVEDNDIPVLSLTVDDRSSPECPSPSLTVEGNGALCLKIDADPAPTSTITIGLEYAEGPGFAVFLSISNDHLTPPTVDIGTFGRRRFRVILPGDSNEDDVPGGTQGWVDVSLAPSTASLPVYHIDPDHRTVRFTVTEDEV